MMHAVSGARSARVPRGSVSRKASSHDVRRSPSDVVKERHRREETTCDACRQRRSNCTFELPSVCVPCLNRGTRCTVTFTPRRTKSDSLKRSQYVRSMQARLKLMEDLLRSAGIDPGDDGIGARPGDDSQDHSSDDEDDFPGLTDNDAGSSQAESTPLSITSPQSSVSDTIRPPNSVFLISESGEPMYYGYSSSYYILSQNGIQFIRDKTGETDWPAALLSQACWRTLPNYWRADIFTDIFACQVYRALPPRSEVFSLLETYFTTLNYTFPIFHEDTFMRMVEWQYTQQDCTDVGRWASINALLALSYRYRYNHDTRPDKDADKAWIYWKNAAAVTTELFLRRNDLLGVQTLLAMGIFARMSGGTREALPLVTAAIQSAEALGLHKKNSRPDLSPTEQETRRRVWWCAFFMDQNISIHTGYGNMQSADEFDIDLPSEDPQPRPNSVSSWSIKWFRTTCTHALVRRRIYEELYTAKAFYKSYEDVCKTVDSLNAELDEWKNQNPYLSYEPPNSMDLDRDQEMEVLAKCGQLLSYRHSLILVNRMPILHEVAIWQRLKPGMDPMKLLSTRSKKFSSITLDAARDSLKLLHGLPWRDVGYTWCLVDYLFVSTLFVFGYILRQPVDPEHGSTEESLGLLNSATTYFKTIEPQAGGSRTAKFMGSMSDIMERTAKKVVDKARRQAEMNAGKQKAAVPVKTEKASNVEFNNVAGIPPAQSSGYFVPGELQNETKPAELLPEIADLNKIIPQPEDQIEAQYSWMLPDMFAPIANPSFGTEPAATSYMNIPFMGEYLGQMNMDVTPGGDAEHQGGNNPAMNGQFFYGNIWNNNNMG